MRRHRFASIARGTLTALALAAAACPVSAGHGGGEGGEGFRHGRGGGLDAGEAGQRRLDRLFEKLELSADQRERVESRLKALREEQASRRDALREARKEMRAATTASPVDEAKVHSAAADLARIRADMAVARAKAREDLRAMLTPEQQKKLDEMKARHREMRAERMERRADRMSRRADRLKARAGGSRGSRSDGI